MRQLDRGRRQRLLQLQSEIQDRTSPRGLFVILRYPINILLLRLCLLSERLEEEIEKENASFLFKHSIHRYNINVRNY
jgi:hypothetical protein